MGVALALKPAPKAADSARQAIINEFGDLDLQIQHMAPIITRHAVLKEIIVDWSKDQPGDKPCVFGANRWTVQFKPRDNRRKIFDPRKAFKALQKAIGLNALMVIITIPLEAAVDRYIPEGEHKLFLTKSREGPRTMDVIPTNPPLAAA